MTFDVLVRRFAERDHLLCFEGGIRVVVVVVQQLSSLTVGKVKQDAVFALNAC